MGVLLLFGFVATGEIFAQTDCEGFEKRSIMAGGTNGASSVVAADVDGDTFTDIIAASSNDDTITWFRNDGQTPPGFVSRVISRDADGVSSVYATDIDGDGDADVLAASANDDTIALYENLGSGPVRAFVRTVISSDALRALSVFAEDVDGDGDTDVLSASFTDHTIAWYENPQITNVALNPDGGRTGFVRRVVSANAINASGVHAADVDGDGDMDLLSASIGDNKIAWYENNGVVTDDNDVVSLEFVEHEIATNADGARSVVSADLDGDGDVDVLSASIRDDKVAWYENIGLVEDMDGLISLTFVEHEITTAADGAKSLFVADIDGDTDLDIVAAAEQAGALYWYQNDGATPPAFVERTVSSDVVSADAVFVADVDHDGNLDVLSASSVPGSVSETDKVAWHRNDGAMAPAWAETVIASTTEGLNSLFLADIDGDLQDDLIASTTTDEIVWYSVTGGGDPVFNRNSVATGVPDARSVVAHDLDGDGDQDIVSASAATDTILWHVNPLDPARRAGGGGGLSFVTTHVITTEAVTVESVFVADVDGDGDGDVLSASSGDDTIAWYENPCGGADCSGAVPPFVEHVIASNDEMESPYRTIAARSVFAIDVDADGDVDVLSASSGDDKVSLFENDGASPPAFVEKIIASGDSGESIFSEGGAYSVSATDVDNDGDVDLLVAASGDGRISWYEQMSDPDDLLSTIFTQRVITTFVPLAVFVSFADIDADGDQDVLGTSLTNDRVIWQENRLEARAAPEDPLLFSPHTVNREGINPRSVVTQDVNADGKLDMLVGFMFESSWFKQIDEQCVNFDANGDGIMDGEELAWLSRAFGLGSATPANEWWFKVDFNTDGVVDGEDLSILVSPGVWGRSNAVVDGVAECSFTCL